MTCIANYIDCRQENIHCIVHTTIKAVWQISLPRPQQRQFPTKKQRFRGHLENNATYIFVFLNSYPDLFQVLGLCWRWQANPACIFQYWKSSFLWSPSSSHLVCSAICCWDFIFGAFRWLLDVGLFLICVLPTLRQVWFSTFPSAALAFRKSVVNSWKSRTNAVMRLPNDTTNLPSMTLICRLLRS